jgi:hypothetical protein
MQPLPQAVLRPARRRWLRQLGRAAGPWLLLPLLPACALLPAQERLRVSVAGFDPLPGEGLELRFQVRLRVLNPNEAAIDYDGVFVEIDLQGRSFASGVAALQGSLPRYGERVLEVPITVSALGAVRQMLGLATGGPWPDKLSYQLRGRIGGGFGGQRFESQGELSLSSLLR